MSVPQAEMGPPPAGYGPPPVEESYGYPPPVPPAPIYDVPPPPPPPAVVYDYPPPPVVYAPPPYYGPYGYYWRGYGPRFAYGYGHWHHGWRR